MSYSENLLSSRVADRILKMITTEKRFSAGDQLPNEIELSKELGVSRTTLREAVRVLSTQGVLEIRRGKGTFVTDRNELDESFRMDDMSGIRVNMKDLYEMRLIFEPQAAYYAAKRASNAEIERIVEYGMLDEERMLRHEEQTKMEQAFHNAIAKATHNDFMNRLIPVINSAVYKGVILSLTAPEVITETIQDHRLIMRYLKARDPEGAKAAMTLHMINTVHGLGIVMD